MSAAVDTALAAKIATVANIATLAPGGIHNSVRPQGSQFPCVVFQLVSSVDMQTFADGGVEWLEYDVKVIAPSAQQANVGALIESIHAVLERGALTITGKTHLQTLRTRRLPTLIQEVSGITYASRGGTYRVWVTA